MSDTMQVEPKAKRIKNFVRSNGRSPYEDWFSRIPDMSVKARILTRIDRLRFGNFGDCKSIGSGVFELRLQFGPGYRVYLGLVGAEVVLLLGGGDKSTQQKDIKLCQQYWMEYKDG
jgi:putative addiction module killer protein